MARAQITRAETAAARRFSGWSSMRPADFLMAWRQFLCYYSICRLISSGVITNAQNQRSFPMNRIKHKIAAALALFGIVMAPAALAQGSASGTASLEVSELIESSISAVRGLQLGQAYPPPQSETAVFGVTCGSGGAFTRVDEASLAAGGTPACGQMNVTVGTVNANFRLQFRATGTTDLAAAGGGPLATPLATEYRLYDASGASIRGPFAGSSVSDSPPGDTISGSANAVVRYFIGAQVTLAADSPLGEYTGAYEVLFTVVP